MLALNLPMSSLIDKPYELILRRVFCLNSDKLDVGSDVLLNSYRI